jgi:hypothetical protein
VFSNKNLYFSTQNNQEKDNYESHDETAFTENKKSICGSKNENVIRDISKN